MKKKIEKGTYEIHYDVKEYKKGVVKSVSKIKKIVLKPYKKYKHAGRVYTLIKGGNKIDTVKFKFKPNK